MPPPRSWVSPPTRREATLLAFSLMIFVLAYNFETSLQMLGVSPSKLSTSYLGKVGIVATDPGYDRDGKRPQLWRDELEILIEGDWDWEEGQVADVERGQLGLSSSHGSFPQPIYNVGKAKAASRSATREDPGIGVTEGVTVNEQIVRWESTIPETKIIAHVPGYTILDNVFMLNGTCYLVTDTPSSIPPLNFIASSSSSPEQAPKERDWRILNRVTAQNILGTFGGRIRGATWLATDPSSSQDPYTLFSMLRAYSHLASPHTTSTISSSGLHIIYPDKNNMGLGGLTGVPPPVRLWFPHLPVFSSPGLKPEGPDIKAHPPLRVKSYIGTHPLLSKAILPTMGLLYTDTWQDYADLQLPFLFDHVLVIDRGAAERGRSSWTERWDRNGDHTQDELRRRQLDNGEAVDGLPVWAAPFVGLDAPREWWAPARAALRSYLGLPATASDGAARKARPTLTYVSMADEPVGSTGARLRDEDHAKLVEGLRALQKEGVLGGVNVVHGNGTREVWEDRMRAIAQSSIVIGAWGHNLADSVFMSPPTAEETARGALAPILMEFFPAGTFVRDQEYAVREAGLRYAAWWDERKFTPDSLPPVAGTHAGKSLYVSVDVPKVLQDIREEARRFQS